MPEEVATPCLHMPRPCTKRKGYMCPGGKTCGYPEELEEDPSYHQNHIDKEFERGPGRIRA